MANLFYKVFNLILLFLSPVILGQSSILYEARLMNDQVSSPNKYEFDIYIKHTGGSDTFQVYGLQVALLFNDSISNGGNLFAEYVAGTSQMAANQIPDNPNINSVANGNRIFKLAAKYAINFGEGTLISKTGDGTRLGRFCIRTDAAQFAPKSINLKWTFSGFSTDFYAWVNGSIAAITDSSSHYTNIQNNPLPIELASFSASAKERDIILNWQTKTEINSSHFEIERQYKASSLNSGWDIIGKVPSSGNSSSIKDYSFTDSKLNSGAYNYRLKMVDNDGTFQYSDIVKTQVALPAKFDVSQNYPNPFNPSTKVDFQIPFSSKINISIYSITGEKVAQLLNDFLEAGYYTTEINSVSLNLASGVYLIRIEANDILQQKFTQTKKIVLAK